ncbi:hypothetical protein KC332_g7796 [Hortaea werneckii]|nr:hypothetical protein KC358_g1362 [Hortaea werneckii]KAI6852103.1 hypothetical protein KC350_g1203 [Hortaea werneckii]KAI6928032.1 hypothetical protein KC348_g8215 [Hortaea werneckii]KAI6934721.1 hypothetical protein KC341_g7442 [Hortaea werneckii]KAI6969221.1 hypothetical protein KC321_g8022 [Hortaea werneckii]
MEVDLSPLINLLQMQLDTGPHYELWEEKRPLPDLLEIAYDTRHRETTDVRDQLYALVALLYRRRPSLVSEFKSDYSMSVQETFEQLEKSLQDSELSHVYKVSGSSQRSLGQTADEKQVANAQSMRDDFQPEIEEVHWARPEVGESGNFSAKQELVSQSQKAVVTGHGASALDHHEALDKAKEFLAGNHLAEAAEQLEQLAGSLKKIAGQRGVVRG